MRWFLYNILFAIGYTLMLPKFLFRMWRRGGYRKGFMERLGLYPEETVRKLKMRPRVWVHAVSVGEMFIALRFIDELRAVMPTMGFVLTATTSTGHAIAEQRLGEQDVLLYFPADFPLNVERVLDQINPRALILTECELWPNIIRKTHKRGIPVILINGRISESSFRGYRTLKAFFGEVVRCFRLFLVQTDRERDMLLDLGAGQDAIKVLGSVKYDVGQRNTDREVAAREWLEQYGVGAEDLVIVGGSTWPGEEAALLDIFARLKADHPRLHLVLVPRHAERRAEVESEIRKRQLTCIRRSETTESQARASSAPGVFLVDTTGELMGFYACASVIFVGKSLTEHGGQNMIEPALVERPVIVGPHTENFPDVVPELVEAGAILQVRDARELETTMAMLLQDADKRAALGKLAGETVRAKQGAIAESIRLIQEAVAKSV